MLDLLSTHRFLFIAKSVEKAVDYASFFSSSLHGTIRISLIFLVSLSGARARESLYARCGRELLPGDKVSGDIG